MWRIVYLPAWRRNGWRNMYRSYIVAMTYGVMWRHGGDKRNACMYQRVMYVYVISCIVTYRNCQQRSNKISVAYRRMAWHQRSVFSCA